MGSSLLPVKLHSRKRVGELFEKGSFGGAKHASARALPSPETGLHLYIAVGGKLGSAVERGRIRRRMRGALRVILDELPPADLAIMPKRGALDCPFQDLISSLRQAVAKAWEKFGSERRDGGHGG